MSEMESTQSAAELRSAATVRRQLDISHVTLWRRIRDPSLRFPQPLKISNRNYFRGAEIDAWIEVQANGRKK